MKTLFGFIGWFVGFTIGLCFSNTVPVLALIFVLGGLPLGRWIGGKIEDYRDQKKEEEYKKQQEKYAREREIARRKERREQAISYSSRYPEATKEFFRIHWGVTKASISQFDITDEKVDCLLSHSEYEYQKLEEKFNAVYRERREAQRQAERLAAEKKRREEMLARQKKDEERRNLKHTLPACVDSWCSHSNSTLKHKYFYDYYAYSQYKDYASSSMRDTWHIVWRFKNDPLRNISNMEHLQALHKVANLVENALRTAFGSKTEYLTLVCLTASTQRKTELRYKDFSEKVCKDLNMTNAFPHIHVIEGGSAKHDGGDGSRYVSYDRSFFFGKYVVLFDDVRTTGHSLEQERRIIEEMGATVICAVTIAQTKH